MSFRKCDNPNCDAVLQSETGLRRHRTNKKTLCGYWARKTLSKIKIDQQNERNKIIKNTKLKDLDPTKKVGDSSRRKPGQALTLKEKKDYWRMYENILEACKEEDRPQSKV